jgi:hypothetical protein
VGSELQSGWLAFDDLSIKQGATTLYSTGFESGDSILRQAQDRAGPNRAAISPPPLTRPTLRLHSGAVTTQYYYAGGQRVALRTTLVPARSAGDGVLRYLLGDHPSPGRRGELVEPSEQACAAQPSRSVSLRGL